MHMKVLPELVGVHIGEGTSMQASTSIADQTVQSAKIIGRGFHHLRDFDLFGHIDRHETCVLAKFIFQGSACSEISAGEDHLRALGHERSCYPFTNAASATCNDGHF